MAGDKSQFMDCFEHLGVNQFAIEAEKYANYGELFSNLSFMRNEAFVKRDGETKTENIS